MRKLTFFSFFIVIGLIAKANVDNGTNQVLQSGDIKIIGFDGDIGNGTDKIVLSFMTDICPGSTFQLVKGNYNSATEGWDCSSLSIQEFEILGKEDISENSILCFDLGEDPLASNFDLSCRPTKAISASSYGSFDTSIDIQSDEPITLFITSGEWVNDGNDCHLIGNVIDGIQVNGTWDSNWIPDDIVCNHTQGPLDGSVGLLNCANLATEGSSILDAISNEDNWEYQAGTDNNDLGDIPCVLDCNNCNVEYEVHVNCNQIEVVFLGDAVAYTIEYLIKGNWMPFDGQCVSLHNDNTARVVFTPENCDPIYSEDVFIPAPISYEFAECNIDGNISECYFQTLTIHPAR